MQRAQRSLQVLGVALEVKQSIGEGRLQLGGALSRGRVDGDLVERSHVVCVCETIIRNCRRREEGEEGRRRRRSGGEREIEIAD